MIRDPLIVYGIDAETDYDTNGLRVLYPTAAEHTLEFGQAGSIHVVCPIDPDGDWESIQLNNVVKAPVEFHGEKKPQLFRIYRIKKSRSSGVPSIEFDARHVFYDLNFVMLDDVRPTGKTCQQAIQWLFDHPYAPNGTSQMPLSEFTFSSDIDTVTSAEYAWKTLSGALIGEDNCILRRWGGELYVDNHYFSINETMEDSEEDAFCIVYGVNLTDIAETVDCTETYSRIAANDNQGHSASSASSISELGLPYEKTLHASFNYTDKTTSAAAFAADFAAYSAKIMEVNANYTVKYEDLDDGDPFWALESCEVGDTGIIRDDELKIETTQRVVKTVTDLITGRRISTETGNIKPSLSRRQPWSNTVTVTESVEQKQIDALVGDVAEAQALRLMTWGTARTMTWNQAAIYTWGKAAEVGGIT